MYIEEEYIKNQFCNNFLNNDTINNIIIYGTGINTQKLLEKVKDRKIIGLMDSKRTGEILYGYKVFSYEEVSEITDSVIVIVARSAVINVIYRRIESFCIENNIKVFDINGVCLSNGMIDCDDKECFSINREELKNKINKANIVTFDIFDTLITRYVMRPRDIFKIMDKSIHDFNFSKIREKSEDELYKNCNPTIFDIYDRIQKETNISDERKKNLISFEIETEKKYLTQRKEVCQLLKYIKKSGKKVYLISDMYFTKKIMEDILAYFDIHDYDDVFVSCEYNVAKQEGLFAEFKKQINVSEKNILHIGDNFFSDCVAAEKEGFDTFKIYSPVEMLESSIYSRLINMNNTIESNIIMSYFAVTAYNNPFVKCCKNGKLILESMNSFSELFLSPIIFKYMIWLTKGVIQNNNDYIIFPSRDGFVLNKIYQYVREKFVSLRLPKSEYFYTSRRAALIASADSECDIEYIYNLTFSGSKEKMLKDRFGIEGNYSLDNLLDEHKKEVFDNCQAEKSNYLLYMDTLEFGKFNNIAITDLVAMGTVQYSLERILKKKLTGYYFLKRSNNDNGYIGEISVYSLYNESGDFQMNSNFYRYYYFLESIITSDEPSLKNFDENKNRIFYNESRDAETIQIINDMQDAIIDSVKVLINLVDELFDFNESVDVYDEILGFFSSDYSDFSDTCIGKIKNTDEFLGRTVSDVNR